VQGQALQGKLIEGLAAVAEAAGVEIPGCNYGDIEPQLNERNNWLALQVKKLELLHEALINPKAPEHTIAEKAA
jgi:hypothetical protein